MNEETLFMENHCFVCGDALEEEKKSVFDTTEHSDKEIYKFVETFVGESLKSAIISSPTKIEVCGSCFHKLEDYDRFCQQAALIQDDITNLYQLTQSIYLEKMAMKFEEELVECGDCNVQFTNIEELNNHECVVAEELDVVDYDDEPTPDEKQEVFEKKTSKSALYTCNTCGDTFEKRRDYSSHVKLAHLPVNAEIFTCSLCKEGFFASEMECKLHTVIAHPDDPSSSSFECPVCLKTFKTKGLVSRHFGIHKSDTERPHICEICGKAFFHSSSIKSHEKIHFDQRDYACSHCSKTFRSQSHLNRHIKTHSNQKNYACSKCGSRFAERYNLTAHMKTHFGIARKRRPLQTTTDSSFLTEAVSNAE